tara:strand:+ start:144 stop:365 length:222 start_codon:yes stop_codon:yes gene_type:complete
MKGIGPNNLGMSKMTGSDCCGIPNCGCGDSAAKFNPTLENKAQKGELPANFAKVVMANKSKSATPLKKRNCSY